MGVGGRLARGRGARGGCSPRGVAVNVERFSAGGWPWWPLARRGRRCEGALRAGSAWACLPRTRLGGRGWERCRQRRRPGAPLADDARGGGAATWSAAGAGTSMCGVPGRAAFCYSLFFFFPVFWASLAGWPRRTSFVFPAWARSEGEGGRWCAHRVRDGNDRRQRKQMGRRVGFCALAKIPAATRHARIRPPPPTPCTHTPRRNNASGGHGNGRRRGPQQLCPYGGRAGTATPCQQSAGGGQSRPASTVRTAGRRAQE